MTRETYTPWDSAEVLTDDEAIVEYLQAALEENDPAFFMKALGNVARAKGITAIAQKAQLGRQNLYNALSGKRNPRVDTLIKVLDALGFQLTVTPKVTVAHGGAVSLGVGTAIAVPGTTGMSNTAGAGTAIAEPATTGMSYTVGVSTASEQHHGHAQVTEGHMCIHESTPLTETSEEEQRS